MRYLGSARILMLVAGVFLAMGTTFDAFQLLIPPRVPKIEEKDYDMKAIATTNLSESEWAGGALFDQRCAMCHASNRGNPTATMDATGPMLSQDTIKNRGEARVREMILKGSPRMPAWEHTLSGEQITNLIAYLKTVTPSKGTRVQDRTTGGAQ